MVAPQHFEQYWQAGVLANKAGFEMNIHGPYYSELLGDRLQRNRSLAKVEAALQAAKTINASTSLSTQDIMVKQEEDKPLTSRLLQCSKESSKESMKFGTMTKRVSCIPMVEGRHTVKDRCRDKRAPELWEVWKKFSR